MIEIVKEAVDIGIATDELEPSQRFWGEHVGLRHDHLLKLGGGVHQHRYDLHGAVLKLNSHREPLADAPTGYVALRVVADVADPVDLRAPDGTPVTLVPVGHDGIVATEVRVEARDADRTSAVIADALGADRDGTQCTIGESRLRVVEVPDRPVTHRRDGLGIRYLTVQVRDVESAHAHALDHGATEGLAPIRLGDTAYISFVRLPDGDWVELSQRASLTGTLPDVSNRVG